MSALERALVALLLSLCAGMPAVAQEWPSRPVQMFVPFAAGGGADGVARLVAGALSGALAQPVVIENRPGAGGIAGTETVANARKDGHTLLFTTPSLVYGKFQFARLPYDPETDLVPVALVGIAPYVMVVNNDFPARDPQALVRLVKAAPGKYDYGSAGVGTATHFVFELFLASAGDLVMTHVPYKGAPAAITDVMSGTIPVLINPASGIVPQIASGKLRGLAVTSSRRLPGLPQVPTFKESGLPDLEVYGWYMILAPKGTPGDLVDRIHAAVRKAITDPVVTRKMAEVNTDVPPEAIGTPKGAAEFLASEFARWAAVARRAGIKPQ